MPLAIRNAQHPDDFELVLGAPDGVQTGREVYTVPVLLLDSLAPWARSRLFERLELVGRDQTRFEVWLASRD